MHSYAIHALPFACTLLNFSVTDVVVKAKHTMTLGTVGVAYSFYNWFMVKRRGEPIYWFLDWKDHKTPLILAMLTLASCLVFYLLSFATQYVRTLRHKKVKSA